MKMNLKIKKPVVGASTLDRVLAKNLRMNVFPPNAKQNQSLEDVFGDALPSMVDLASDSFRSMYKNDPKVLEEVPDERLVNQAVMQYIMGQSGWSNEGVAGNLPAALASGSMLFSTALNDDVIKAALEKQAEAERLKKEAQEGMKNGMDGSQIAELLYQASKAAREGAHMVDNMADNPMGKAKLAMMNNKAKEEGEKVNGLMRGWGLEPGDITDIDEAEEILSIAQDKVISAVAELIGRARGLAVKNINMVRQSFVGQVVEHHFTQDITKVAPSELALLSPLVPEVVRVHQMFKLITDGLFGIRPKVQGKRKQGSMMILVDESGSMSGKGCQRAKAIAIGIVQAVRAALDPKRYYELYGFSSGHRRNGILVESSFPKVTAKDDWREHIKWIKKFIGGGTNFDEAFELAVGRLEDFSKMAIHAADLVFLSDGMAYMNDATINLLHKMKTEMGVRIVYFQIGHYPNEEMKKIADFYGELPDPVDFDEKQFIDTITEIITKHFLTEG